MGSVIDCDAAEMVAHTALEALDLPFVSGAAAGTIFPAVVVAPGVWVCSGWHWTDGLRYRAVFLPPVVERMVCEWHDTAAAALRDANDELAALSRVIMGA